MKTQAQNKLDFTKKSITELNNSQLRNINGGTMVGVITTDPNGSSNICQTV